MSEPEYPKMMYHKFQAPHGWRIDSEAEYKHLGPGWVDEPIAVKPKPAHVVETVEPEPPAPAKRWRKPKGVEVSA